MADCACSRLTFRQRLPMTMQSSASGNTPVAPVGMTMLSPAPMIADGGFRKSEWRSSSLVRVVAAPRPLLPSGSFALTPR